jgi:hypothetical protein
MAFCTDHANHNSNTPPLSIDARGKACRAREDAKQEPGATQWESHNAF